eukprot:CAMPEP_0184305260 /NCGR_PEP_ID=MMETSP1049-20130417/14575_1 /TAXON_ID=77928 /ORGANISM="Proteomonas sulcata, Strain CCMP704" /LENGTH=569 /DNA_ID=CAMNT_0026617277 /DNA_START=26 /DNA_END=1735 /DNA_ORIENTATION=+
MIKYDFHHMRTKVHTEVDDAASDAVKLDRTLVHVKYATDALEHIRARIKQMVVLEETLPMRLEKQTTGIATNGNSNLKDSAFMFRLQSSQLALKREVSGQPSPMGTRELSKPKPDTKSTSSKSRSLAGQRGPSSQPTCSKQASGNWRHKRHVLTKMHQRNSILSSIAAVFGVLCSVSQNEIVIQNGSPTSAGVNLLKALNTLSTIALIALLCRSYWIDLMLDRLNGHVKKNLSLSTPITYKTVLSSRWLWVEIFFCSLHLPPFCTFEMEANAFENFLLYRAETVFTFLNTLRLYVLWRVFRDWILSDLPATHSISLISEVHLGSRFAFKRILNGPHAGAYIACFWASMTLLMGYWFRSAELQACFFSSAKHPGCQEHNARWWKLSGGETFEKNNDLYMQNSLWLIFITATSVGYGDIVPTTHFGRATAGTISVLGIVNASLLTASLANALMYSSGEVRVMILLEREKARLKLVDAAASVLGLWWRYRHRKRASFRGIVRLIHKDNHPSRKEAWHNFQKAKRRVKVGVEECVDIGQKISKVWKQTRSVERSVDMIGVDLWKGDMKSKTVK